MDTVKDAATNVTPGQIAQFTGHRIDTVDEYMRHTEHTGPKNYGRGFLAMMTGKEELVEGYLPVARLVLEAARRKLHRLRKALRQLGPAAGKTDCCYVPVP